MTVSTHSDARTRSIVAKADAAGFELNDRARWLLHNVVTAPGAAHLDDDQAALFSRSLEQQITGVLEMPKPELPLASSDEMVPSFSIDAGATSYRYFLQDSQGEWQYGAGGGGDDLPTASVSGAEMVGRTQIAYGAFGYTREDLRNWGFASRGALPTMLQTASMRGKLQLQDETLAWGKESLDLQGLFNYPGSTRITAADNGAGSTDWLDKTIDQIVADIGALIDSIEDATNLMRHATKVLWSRRVDRFLRRTRIVDGTTGSGMTFYEYIKKVFVTGGSVPNGPDLEAPQNPIDFMWVRYMDGTNERSEKNGVPQLPVVSGNRTDSMFAYIHNNPDVVAKVVTPLAGNFLPPETRGVKIQVTGEAKWGGIRSPEPVTMARMDGVFGNPAP
jgi:hypothetical protein